MTSQVVKIVPVYEKGIKHFRNCTVENTDTGDGCNEEDKEDIFVLFFLDCCKNKI